jgi:hypothetical protein
MFFSTRILQCGIQCAPIDIIWILSGCSFRNLADKLADMDFFQGDVKEDNGLSMYKYTYAVDVYIHIIYV